jgi:hypothetical protein
MPVAIQANTLVTGGEDANFLAWSCASLPKEENGMSSSSLSVLVKRDHDGDVEMNNLSPKNVSIASLITRHLS